MLNRIRYNFNELERVASALKSDPNQQTLSRLKNELNKLFKDCNCKEVLYTNNTDSLFFGMCVIPYINNAMVDKILATNEKIRINEYYLEIDSKLFEINLSAREIVSILLHEIGHLVNTAKPVEETRKAMDLYLTDNNTHLILSDASQYKEILAFGIRDTMRKLTSLFERNDEEKLADSFVVDCGYGVELENALRKVVSKTSSLNKHVDNKLIVLQWTLRLYRDVKYKRIAALHTINKSKKVTGSSLVQRELTNLARKLQEIDDEFMIKESANIFKKMYGNFKYKGLRSLEDDLFELSLQVKNVDDKDDALIIMRQINSRLSIVDDYIRTEDLSDEDMNRWLDTKGKFESLRTELSKKHTYEKYLGLFVNSPVIKSRYDY